MRARTPRASTPAIDPELLKQGFVTVPEAARRLAVSRPTLYRWMDTGLLPWLSVTSGTRGIRRIAVKHLEAFVAQHMKGGWKEC